MSTRRARTVHVHRREPHAPAPSVELLPATATTSVRTLAHCVHDVDVDIDAAIVLVRDAVQDTVRLEVARMVAEQLGPALRHDLIGHTTVGLGRAHRDQRLRLLGVLGAAMCVAVRRHNGSQARLTGRSSDLIRARMLFEVVGPVADRVVGEDVTRPQHVARRAPAGSLPEVQLALQLATFTSDVQEWMRVSASEYLHRAGPAAVRALRHRWAVAGQAADIAAGTRPARPADCGAAGTGGGPSERATAGATPAASSTAATA